MSEPAASQTDHKAKPWTKQFRKRASRVPATPEHLRRMDSLLRRAWLRFGASGPMIAFLNSYNEQLGAQPLVLALESDEGSMRVESLLDGCVRDAAKNAE